MEVPQVSNKQWHEVESDWDRKRRYEKKADKFHKKSVKLRKKAKAIEDSHPDWYKGPGTGHP